MTIAPRKFFPLLVAILAVALTGCSPLQDDSVPGVGERAAIIELCNRYAHAMDHGDPEAWLATWAPEGSAETPWDGYQTYAEMAVHARREWGEQQPHRHILANHVVAIEGDTATHRCYAFLVRIGEKEAQPRFIVEYSDKLRKLDGEWKFVHRQIVLQE